LIEASLLRSILFALCFQLRLLLPTRLFFSLFSLFLKTSSTRRADDVFPPPLLPSVYSVFVPTQFPSSFSFSLDPTRDREGMVLNDLGCYSSHSSLCLRPSASKIRSSLPLFVTGIFPCSIKRRVKLSQDACCASSSFVSVPLFLFALSPLPSPAVFSSIYSVPLPFFFSSIRGAVAG